MQTSDIIVIGNGPAGVTAAIYGVRAALDVLVFAGPISGGQILQTNDMENYPGFIEPVSGYELMDKMHKQAERLGAKVVHTEISSIDTSSKPFKLTATDGNIYAAKTIVIASGVKPRWTEADGEDKYKGRGISSCATCDGMFFKNKDVVVIGGGNTAFEDVLYLSKICNKVYLVHRREGFRAAQKTVEKVKACPNVEMVLNYTAESFEGDSLGLNALKVKNLNDQTVRELPCQGVFVAIGGVPQTAFLKNSGVELEEDGIIKIDESGKTNIEGIFAAGDCTTEQQFRQVVIAAGAGAKAAVEAINYINLN
ncbi:Thioredoxin reductase [Elusimicrobium minutum Pei191]|uniref:Thioredoxin reductase n=1 Tax=Elusimicrobium minutum (strain Pei191) TaxID=445932 RepID=B2KC31_ELUMP|nr:thioredoxin-disulfide reductase [Elusimicrobium minutum]ACC98158.1 Thioredoxin reductase [Elusimicrobium minutum Pei191]